MNIKTLLMAINVELLRIYAEDFDFSQELSFPDFTTAKNGMTVTFPDKARALISELSDLIYENHKETIKKIDKEKHYQAVKQSIAEIFSEGKLDLLSTAENIGRRVEKEFKKELKEIISKNILTVTHHIFANTILSETFKEISFGNIKIELFSEWILRSNFSSIPNKKLYPNEIFDSTWKKNLIQKINKKDSGIVLDNFGEKLYGISKDASCVISIEISGYEKTTSRKIAKLISKSSLDFLSLLCGIKQVFLQNTISEGRNIPFTFHPISSIDGLVGHPGMSFTDRVNKIDPNALINLLNESKTFIEAFEFITCGIIDIDTHPHPELCIRWLTALDWYAEAQREETEAIALAKLGISLDTLSNGGKADGIIALMKNLSGMAENGIVKAKPKEINLKDLVYKLYNNGRSRIVHGDFINRLQTYDVEIADAAYLCRFALIECALRLKKYSGEDEPNAFKQMP